MKLGYVLHINLKHAFTQQEQRIGALKRLGPQKNLCASDQVRAETGMRSHT